MPSGLVEDSDYRLPRTVLPRRYELRVAPDFATRSFEGEVAIEIELTEPGREILCNAADLEVSEATIRREDGTETSLEVALDRERERVRLGAPVELGAGRYVLSCRFAAELGSRLRGFYASTFKDPAGDELLIASTHFEATDARRAFPCFDEPDMKAVFAITLDVPDGLFAVSNSPEAEITDLGGETRRVRFEDTMPMSTYLVAYAVGPFEATEPAIGGGVPIRVVVPKGRLHLTAYALQAAQHALGWFHEYFDLPYPAEKLDLVAIPDFAMGAMENLGCVTFREQDLLCSPEDSSIPELMRIAEVVEHELAHMWFGDLVTMRWWNGIWLNEAFATFMSVCCLDAYRPQWNRWPMFGMECDAALRIDGLHSTRPIEFPVRAPDEADAMFDHLTYEKGGSVLRMLEQYLGAERFREGVRKYLRQHAYANTETTDLWDAIESASQGAPVRAMLDSWIFQGGYPLVTAHLEDGRAKLSAEPFAYLPANELPAGSETSAIGSDWLVPVLVEDRPGTVEAVVVGPEPHGRNPVDIGAPQQMLVARAGGSGAYRLRYEGHLFDQILANLEKLEPLERFNLVSDSWACTLADMSGLGDFFALVRSLGAEQDPNVWEIVSSALAMAERAAAAGAAEPALASFTRQIAGPIFDTLGFEVTAADTPDAQRVRAILIELLGFTGSDERVRDEAGAAFERSRSGGAELPPSIAEPVLSVVVAQGGADEFAQVLAGFRQPADPLSEYRHLVALTRTRRPELADELLAMTLDEIRAQDGHFVIRALMQNRFVGPRAWRFVVDNFAKLSARLPTHAMATVFGGVAFLVQVDAEGRPMFVEETRSFVDSHDFGGHRRLVDQALERQLVHARFVTARRSDIGELLAKA